MGRQASLAILAAAVIAVSHAYGCQRSPAAASHPQIQLNVPSDNSAAAFVEVTGVSSGDLAALRAGNLSDDVWAVLLRVTVEKEGERREAGGERKNEERGEGELPAILGSYAVQADTIRFTPRFPFDAGRAYKVVFDTARLPSSNGAGSHAEPLIAMVRRPKPIETPSTVVASLSPTADEVPENQLRLYLHFSAPMSRRNGLDFVHLVDEKGREIEGPFLPLDTDLWNDDRTRYTVFFDPGRVKKGILPRKEMGPSLEAGHRYTLVVDAAWPDAKGLPLKEAFRRPFRVGTADERPLDPKTWRIASPAAAGRDPVVVTFPEPLDQGLLFRALGVARDGHILDGDVRLEASETRWLFTPRDGWKPGEYQLVALSILEDLAGNRIGRAFEVDRFDEVDSRSEPERFTVPFRIR